VASKAEEERALQKRMKELDAELAEREKNVEALATRVKEREQESRLTALKASEMKRIIRLSKPPPRSLKHSSDICSKPESAGEKLLPTISTPAESPSLTQ
jgi:hypothetical protein